jgi:hypothetical protein
MSAIDITENGLLNHIFGGGDWARPGTVHIGLSTTTPNDAGGNFTEPGAGGYTRALVLNNGTNFPVASGGTKSNGVDITFVQASGAGWGTITHFGIFSQASAGTALFTGSLSQAKNIADGDTAKFAATQLVITCD